MTYVPLTANVECSDGPLGRTGYVIIDPEKETLARFMVQDR